jgi:hypothetical protein
MTRGRRYFPKTGYRLTSISLALDLARRGHHGYYLVRVKHRYWASNAVQLGRVHIVRPEAVAPVSKGRFDSGIHLKSLCNAFVMYAVPVGPDDGGRELCPRCVRIAEGGAA